MARYIFYLTVLIGVAVYAFVLYQSRAHVDENLFRNAEIFCLDQQWDQARVALTDVLRENPNHAGAHFYLGRAYMFGTDFRPIMAEGEFLVALNLFRSQGKASPIDRFPPKYFEMMCYVEAAKANLVQIDVYLRAGAGLEAVQNLVADASFYADQAQKIYPEAEEVRDLMNILDSLSPRFKKVRPRKTDEPARQSPQLTV